MEMAEVFRRKVSVKMERLREAEATLNREMIEEMKSLEQEKEIVSQVSNNDSPSIFISELLDEEEHSLGNMFPYLY